MPNLQSELFVAQLSNNIYKFQMLYGQRSRQTMLPFSFRQATKAYSEGA